MLSGTWKILGGSTRQEVQDRMNFAREDFKIGEMISCALFIQGG